MTKAIVIVFAIGLAMQSQAGEFDDRHALFDQVLKRFVKDGLVDYKGLKADPKHLDSYLQQLAAVPESEFKKWSKSEQLVFFINLYNAATLRLIVDHYPVTSIKKIGGLFSGPWKQPVVRLFGQTTTLDHVEHGILRKNYDEPRIHFALVCAALGCPKLRGEPYTAAKLDEQLNAQGKEFLVDKTKNSMDLKTRTVYLSPIFKWFAEDFEARSSSVLKFVQRFFPEEVRAELAKGGFKIKYTDYDWSLNDLTSRK